MEKIKIYLPTSGKTDDLDKVMEKVNAITIYASYAWNMGIIYREDVVKELGLEDMVAGIKTIKDIQTQTDAFTTLTQNDAAFSTLGQTDFNTQFYQTTTIGKPINIVIFGGGVPVARTYNNVTYTVMSNVQHAEACMKFLNLWFSDEEIGNLISYGIEGEHYVLNDDGMGEYLPGQDANSCAYHPGSGISNTNFL